MRAHRGPVLALLLVVASLPASAQAWVESTAQSWVESASGRRALSARQLVPVGARIRTGDGGYARLILPDGSRVTVETATTIQVTRSRAAATAVSVRTGRVRVATGSWRWPGEAFEVTSPIVTTGVRGTRFTVNVSPEGEATIVCDRGVVAVGGETVVAGQHALAGFAAPVRVDAAPILSSFAALPVGERRRIAVAALGGLMEEAVERRKAQARHFVSTLRELHAELRRQEDDDEDRLPGIAKLARLVTVFRRSLNEARDILGRDREAGLREETLRSLLETEGVPPLVAWGARAALARADRDRAQRDRDLAQVEAAIDRTGEGLVKLATAAAADPRGAATTGRILRDGLGIDLDAELLPDDSVRLMSPADLGWTRGSFWMQRTLRGRTEARTTVMVTPVADATGWTVARAPLAFDTSLAVHAFLTETAAWLDDFPGVPQVTRRRPALYYKFPLAVGDRWTAWQAPGLPALALRLERTVTAAERVATPAGTWDCVRVETRLRFGRASRAPLVHVEWLAPGVGPVREFSFRREYQSVAWDERIPAVEPSLEETAP